MPIETSIYRDIAARTGGDVYIGVVGPVRTGKSTFIKKFMEKVVLPQIESESERARANDEMPQSASGKTVMTTEPKFVPDEAVKVSLSEGLSCRVKLIDCVGYVVPGAAGTEDENGARLVHTPWSEEAMPFEEAAEIGTRKVIGEHSTIAVAVLWDGGIAEIPRANYAEAEERVIRELKETGKPFTAVLNSAHPESEETAALARELGEKYGVPVRAENCFQLTEERIREILKDVILQFPPKEVRLDLPEWIMAAGEGDELKNGILDAVSEAFGDVKKTGEIFRGIGKLAADPRFGEVTMKESDLGTGRVALRGELKKELFYRVLSDECGIDVKGEKDLLFTLRELAAAKARYDKIASALDEVNEKGYGIVTPEIDDLTLEEPEIVKQPGGYGVKLRASAPSIHMIRANIRAEISPIVGSERQSEDIVKYLLAEFEEDPARLWNSNMFGKSLYELVGEGLNAKLDHMPEDARARLAETLQKIINEGCSGLVCIIL